MALAVGRNGLSGLLAIRHRLLAIRFLIFLVRKEKSFELSVLQEKCWMSRVVGHRKEKVHSIGFDRCR